MNSRSTRVSRLPASSVAIAAIALLCAAVLAAPLFAVEEQAVIADASFFEDSERASSPDMALQRLRRGEGETLPNLRFNEGNRDSHYWLLLRIDNRSSAAQRRLLDLGVPYRSEMTVFLLDEGMAFSAESARVILATDDNTGFQQRSLPTLYLHSEPFLIPPSTAVEVLIDYGTRGSTYMPLSLKQPAQFLTQQRDKQVGAALFYAVCIILLLVFLMLGLVLKEKTIALYAGLFFVSLLFIAAMEGYAFQFLWPNAPVWNQYASLVLWLLSIAGSFFVAVYALDPHFRSKPLDRSLIALGGLAILLAALCRFIPFSPLITVTSFLMLLAYLAHARTIASWVRRAPEKHLISFVSIALLLPLIISSTLLAFLSFDVPDLVFLYGNRSLFFFAITATLAALLIQIMGLRREHENALQKALSAAERDVKLSRALLESEQKYMHAKQLAQQHKMQLASTSHDIRQPLVSLRATMEGLPLEKKSAEWASVNRALDYIEQLSQPQGDASTPSYIESHDAANSPYRADLVLQTLLQMFEAEALHRNIVLKMSPCSVVLQHDPLILVRILSNLTANAIKHCSGDKVLLGCRRRGDFLRFDVIDSGPGLSAAEVARISAPYEKGKESAGEGLGLSICQALAQDNGMHLEIDSAPGKGSRFSVYVPA